jgi:hypothetical protein
MNALATAPEPSDEVAAQHYRTEQAKRVITGLSTLLRIRIGAAATPEAAFSEAWPFVEGWMAAVQLVSPEMLEDVGAEMEAALCDADTDPALQLVLVRIGEQDPMLRSQRGLACTVERYTHGDLEPDLTLRSALDAWQASALPVTPELDRLVGTRDEHIQRQLARIRGEAVEEEPQPHGDESPVPAEQLAPLEPEVADATHREG